jgi:hypothetical protein
MRIVDLIAVIQQPDAPGAKDFKAHAKHAFASFLLFDPEAVDRADQVEQLFLKAPEWIEWLKGHLGPTTVRNYIGYVKKTAEFHASAMGLPDTQHEVVAFLVAELRSATAAINHAKRSRELQIPTDEPQASRDSIASDSDSEAGEASSEPGQCALEGIRDHLTSIDNTLGAMVADKDTTIQALELQVQASQDELAECRRALQKVGNLVKVFKELVEASSEPPAAACVLVMLNAIAAS